MTTPKELESKLWKALQSDRTVMLGLDGVDDGHTRPMTAMIERERGPLWFFTATDNQLVKQTNSRRRAIASFSSKGHEVFASIHGALSVETDRAVVDRLWNPFIAAWYEGRNDPRLALLRLDPEHAEVWLNESSLLAGIQMLFGIDPTEKYRDRVADVPLGGARPAT